MPHQPHLLLNPGRHRIITSAGLAGAAAIIPGLLQPAWGDPHVSSVFTLGVASGDPADDRVPIWTRLAPDPLNGGGMGGREADVEWQVSRDPAMRHRERAGRAEAHARNGHAVWINVDGLHPATTYYYRFQYRGTKSRIGRTRTFPHRSARPAQMRFALASCQHYESGYYAALIPED